MNAFRKELALLAETPDTKRPPVLRRSLRDEWLYATDLPGLCGEEETERFLSDVRAAGWEALQEEGWIQLRKRTAEPPEGWYDGAFGPEAKCCLSLLRRQRDRHGEEDWITLTLLKAAEEGEKAYENACFALHRAWAGKLRRKEGLPDVSPLYFGETIPEE